MAFTLFSTCVSYHPNILIIKGDYKCIPKHSTLKKVFKMQRNSAAQWSATEAQGILSDNNTQAAFPSPSFTQTIRLHLNIMKEKGLIIMPCSYIQRT